MRSYEDLTFYQDMYALTLELYPVLRLFPRGEQYGLAQQMRRAAVSYLSNIAEGSGRGTDGEYANSVSNASGSAAELDCQIKVSRDLGMIDPIVANDFVQRLESIRRRTNGYYRWLKKDPNRRPPSGRFKRHG